MTYLLSEKLYWYRRLFYLGIALTGFAVIYFASGRFIGDYGLAGFTDDQVRHVIHFFGFGGLAWLLAKAMGNRYAAAWVIVLFFSAGDEIHQAFVPFRTADVNDWLVNLAGISTMLILARLFEPRIKRWALRNCTAAA